MKVTISSSININLSKTSILGKTFVNGEEFYIGKNGEFINHNQIFEQYKIQTAITALKNENSFLKLVILNGLKLIIGIINSFPYFMNIVSSDFNQYNV